MHACGQVFGGERDGAVITALIVHDDIDGFGAAAPQGCAAGAWVLRVNRRHVKVGLLLADGEDVLITSAAALITILHEHAILLLAIESNTPGGIAQMTIKGANPMP